MVTPRSTRPVTAKPCYLLGYSGAPDGLPAIRQTVPNMTGRAPSPEKAGLVITSADHTICLSTGRGSYGQADERDDTASVRDLSNGYVPTWGSCHDSRLDCRLRHGKVHQQLCDFGPESVPRRAYRRERGQPHGAKMADYTLNSDVGRAPTYKGVGASCATNNGGEQGRKRQRT